MVSLDVRDRPHTRGISRRAKGVPAVRGRVCVSVSATQQLQAGVSCRHTHLQAT